jgi:asparagine synthase (glutamine-hydrolysing)
MCGIFCAIDKSKGFEKDEIYNFDKSLEIIKYRGPDASNTATYFTQSNLTDKANVFLGHNRLSILDLSPAGTQPFVYLDRYHIIFNGEIYNYLEIKEELQKKGFVFRTSTDTEVLLALYVDGGVDAFKRLNGMWAFIIYDEVKQKLIVSRDRFGEKPIYYYKASDERYYFASEIKQLLTYGNFTVNKKVLSNYLYSYILDNTNETFYAEIQKVPQSSVMTFDFHTGKVDILKYWEFDLNDNFNNKSESYLIEQFREFLTDSIKIRLRSDVPIGNTLSGGLDSSSIAVISAKFFPESFTNISVVSKVKAVSEEKFVDDLISNNHLQVKKLLFDERDPLADAEKVIWHHDEPILSVSTIAHYQMMKLINDETNITVVLSGQGGDEALAGYNKYFFYALKEKFKSNDYGGLFKDGLHLLNKFKSEFRLADARRYTGIEGNAGKVLNSILSIPKEASSLNSFKDFKDRQLKDYFHYSVPPLCHYEDRNSMAFSKEIRLPFLDHRLAEFCVNLPLNMKVRSGVSKYILRKSITDLPKSIAERKDKKGFALDEDRYYTGENLVKIREMLADSKLAEMGFVHQDVLSQSLQGSKSTLWSRDLGRILFAEIWLRSFFK